MGFGLMIIGYIIAYGGSMVSQISALTYILGSGIIIFSLRKLIYENKLFIASILFAFLLEVSSIISLGIQLFYMPTLVSDIFGYVATGSSYMLGIFLMLGILMLSKEAEAKNVEILSLISTILVGTTTVFYVLCQTVTADYTLERLYVIHFVLNLTTVILSTVTIFNAYARICYEGDENMQRETSGIPLFDALNKLFEKAFTRKNDKGKK